MSQDQEPRAPFNSRLQSIRHMAQKGFESLSSASFIKPFSVAWGSRFALYLLVFVFVGLFPGEPGSKPDFWQALSQWDGQWYLKIATEGYRWHGPTTQSAIVFFPLYPILGKIAGVLVGNLNWGFLIVTTVSFFFFIFYLYRLTCLDFSEPVAERAIVYAAIFPGAFVLGAFYTEATAFALCIAAFYYARVGRWRLAIVLGFFTALTRLPALVILFPIAFEYWRQRGVRWQAIFLGIIPLGALAFVAYIGYLTGNPWAIFQAEGTVWFRTTVPPWELVQVALERATWLRTDYIVSVNLLDAASILSFIGLTIWTLVKMPAAYWIYAIPALILALSTTVDPAKAPPTSSVTRYLMAIFPGYIALAQIARSPLVDQTVRWTFALLMGVFAIYFFSQFWVL